MTGKLLNNKKGFATELMVLVVIGIFCLVFFAMWRYGINTINDELIAIPASDNASNISAAASATFSYMSSGLDNLKIVSLFMIVGFVLATLIMAYFIGTHPLMLFVYVVLIIFLVILSVYVSNAYEDLLSEQLLGAELQDFAASNFIMAHLPVWVGVIGMVGILLSVLSIYLRRDTYG